MLEVIIQFEVNVMKFAEAYSEPSHTSKIELWLSAINSFHQKLHLGCLTRLCSPASTGSKLKIKQLVESNVFRAPVGLVPRVPTVPSCMLNISEEKKTVFTSVLN